MDGRAFTVVRHAVTHQHVKFVFVVFDGQHHGHGLADFHDAGHFGGPRSLAHLNLHPALQVVAEEVGGDRVEHVDLKGTKRDCLLVKVVPRAAQFSSLIPDLLHEWIVLDDNGVLDEATAGRRVRVGGVMASGGSHTAAVQEYFECGT